MSFTKETFEKSMVSYQKAMHELIEIAGGKYQFDGSGCPHLDVYRSGHMKACLKPEVGLPHANRVSARHEGLFDFGRPKQVQPNHWVARSDFFKLDVWAIREWTSFSVEPGKIVVDTGERTGPKDRSWDCSMSLKLLSRSWGCAGWLDKVGEIQDLAEHMPDEIGKQFLEAVESATDTYNRWKQAIQESAEVASAI